MNKHTKYRKPYITKGLYIGFIIFLLLAALFILFYRHNLLLLSYLLTTSLLISGFCTHLFIAYFAKRQTFGYLNQFSSIAELGAYKEAMNAFHAHEKKYDHFVLLLHGFTASPHEMQQLIKDLDEKQIPYFAPMLTGFGLIDFHLLNSARHEDFFRLALDYYDFLSSISKKVSIVAHSMGAVLATFIAKERNVHRLVLSAPALYFFPEDRFIIKLLTTPVISNIFIKLVPYLPKTVKKSSTPELLKAEFTNTRFQYLSVPSHAVKHMLFAKMKVDITKIQNTDLYIIYGDKDRVVNVEKCLATINEANIAYRVYCIKDAGHNLYEDTSKHEASNVVLQWLL